MRGLKHYMEPYTLVCTLASSQESEFHKLRFHDDQNIMARTFTVDVKNHHEEMAGLSSYVLD